MIWPGPCTLEQHCFLLQTVGEGNLELLQLIDEVGRILDHMGDRIELARQDMRHFLGVVAGHMNRRNRITLYRGEQDPPQRVAHRDAESSLKRIGDETAEVVVYLAMLEGDALWSLEPLQ